MHAGHLIPQYDLIFDSRRGRKLVQHVLRFVNFTVDTDDRPLIERKKEENAKLTERDLYPETQDLIRRVYAKDFELGGYDARKIGDRVKAKMHVKDDLI
jgi:hypothetical protein